MNEDEVVGKPYRIKVSVRNNLLLSAIEEQGYESVAAFERASEIKLGRINGLVAMREAPINNYGEFTPSAKKVMEVLGAAPTDLWTEQQLTIRLKTNVGERAIDASLVQHLIEQRNKNDYLPSPEDELLAAETSSIIHEVLGTLSPREQVVLQGRFEEGLTLGDTGERLGITRTRVQQIECRALKKLRNNLNDVEEDLI